MQVNESELLALFELVILKEMISLDKVKVNEPELAKWITILLVSL